MHSKIDQLFNEVVGFYDNKLNPGYFERWVTSRKGKIPKQFITPASIPVDPSDNEFVESQLKLGMDFKTFLSLGFGWLYGNAIIDAAPEMITQMMETPPSDIVPMSWLDAIPGWTTYIPLTTETDIDGILFARRKYNDVDTLIIIVVMGMDYSMHMHRVVQEDDGFISFAVSERLVDASEAEIDSTKRMINTVLFLCMLIPHQPSPVKPTKRVTRSKRVTYAINPRKPCVISIRNAQDEYLKEYDTDTASIVHNHRKAHMRRAHWRTYWTGPRSSEQVKVLRWIPPTFVKGFVAE